MGLGCGSMAGLGFEDLPRMKNGKCPEPTRPDNVILLNSGSTRTAPVCKQQLQNGKHSEDMAVPKDGAPQNAPPTRIVITTGTLTDIISLNHYEGIGFRGMRGFFLKERNRKLL